MRLIPKRLFVINMLITSIYTIGVLSALYAGLLAPERSTTAVMASGLINGIATMLLAIFVDPKVSVLADDVAKGKRSYIYLKWTSVTMVTSRVAGTLLAQLMFIPGAYYIALLQSGFNKKGWIKRSSFFAFPYLKFLNPRSYKKFPNGTKATMKPAADHFNGHLTEKVA